MYLFKCIELAVGVIKVRPLIYYKRNILNMCSEDFWLNSPFSSENILLLSPETLYSLIPTITRLCSLFVGEMLCPCEEHFVHAFLLLQGATRGFWTWYHSTSLAALHSHRLESSWASGFLALTRSVEIRKGFYYTALKMWWKMKFAFPRKETFALQLIPTGVLDRHGFQGGKMANGQVPDLDHRLVNITEFNTTHALMGAEGQRS